MTLRLRKEINLTSFPLFGAVVRIVKATVVAIKDALMSILLPLYLLNEKRCLVPRKLHSLSALRGGGRH